jgi:hypothetical protein
VGPCPKAELCSQNAAELEKPLPTGLDEMRARAFEIFDEKAEALLMLVSVSKGEDAFCGIVPVVARAALWECRVGRPQQYCTPLSPTQQRIQGSRAESDIRGARVPLAYRVRRSALPQPLSRFGFALQ